MTMSFSEYLNKGNECFFELFSSFGISKDEHDQIVKKYIDYIKGHAVESSDISDPGPLLYGTILKFSDEEISNVLNDKKSSYSELKRAISMCERQKRILDVFNKNKWGKIDLANTNVDKCIEKLTKREAAVSLTNKIIEEDKELTDLIRMAQLEHSIAICNRALDTSKEMFADIALCKEKRTAVPKIANKDEETVNNKINGIKTELEEIEKLHKKMFDNDLRLSNMEPLIKAPSTQWDEIISICKKQIKNINELQAKKWPAPQLKIQKVKDVEEILSLYKEMMELDEEICSMRNNVYSEAQYAVFQGKCKKQMENIKKCKSLSVQTPGIKVQKPNELLQIVIKELGEKQRAAVARKNAQFTKWAIIVVLIAVAIGVVFYLSTLVRTPYNSESVVGEEMEVVCEAFEEAGFTEIKTIPDDSGWYEDYTVLSVVIDGEDTYRKGAFKKPESIVEIIYSSPGRECVSDCFTDWEKEKYDVITKRLTQAGFKNVVTIEEDTFNEERDEDIAKLVVNGKDYTEGLCYILQSSPIEVHYYKYKIQVETSSDGFYGQDYKDVVSNLENKGFSNIAIQEKKDGWAPGNSVVAVLFDDIDYFSENDAFTPDVEITVVYSSDDRLDASSALEGWEEMTNTQLKSSLMSRGFTNITMVEKITDDESKNNYVSSVIIGENTYFAGDCFIQSSTYIEIEYYSHKITTGKDATSYIGEQYSDVVDELTEQGFTNILLMRGNNLVTGWVTEEGSIQSISIDGNSDFTGDEYLDPNVSVEIIVNTFEGSGCEDITDVAD